MSGFAEGTPTVEITLDKPRTLGFTLGAMRRAKELGVLNADPSDEVGFMLAMPEYVWACLSEEGRAELSVAQIGELMNPLNIKAIGKAVGELFSASLPKENPPATKKPTGGSRKSTSTSSGRLASTTSVSATNHSGG